MNIRFLLEVWPTKKRARAGVATAAVGALVLAGLTVMSAAQAAGNPYDIDGDVADAGTTFYEDPEGNTQELGPLNSNGTKLGVIDQAAPPMLGTTNPNAQVDLKGIWLDVTVNGDDNKAWMYLAWDRDSNRGSGVIQYEFHASAPPAACDYTKIPAEQDDLIATCNPWQNRKPGDFIIVWDQSGGNIDIILRTWGYTDANADGDWDDGVDPLVLNAGVSLTGNGNAFAALSSDNRKGEAAVNLTDTVFQGAGCTSIGNVIPGTVTGNSDTADYKDTVFASIADSLSITNCGVVLVRKTTTPTSTDNFGFSVTRTGGAALRYTVDGYSGADLTSATGTLAGSDNSGTTQVKENETSVIDLIAGTNYLLAETSGVGSSSAYALSGIVCTRGTGAGQVTYQLYPDPDPNDGVTPTFTVVAGETTTCTITNVSGATVQSWVLHDKLRIPTTLPTTGATVTFRLYSDAACAVQVGSDETDNTIVAGAGADAGFNVAQTSTGVAVSSPGTYRWRAAYNGGSTNASFTTACGSEITRILAQDAVNSDPIP